MSQVTWRASEELVRDVKRVAAEHGKSVNEFLTQLAIAATDPDYAADPADRIRERLARGGLLAPPVTAPSQTPSPQAVEAARREAGHGTALSQVLSEDRG